MQLIIAVVSAIGMFGVFMPAYLLSKRNKESAISLTFKGACTLIAVLLSFAGAVRSGSPAAWCMTVGLFVCMIGDVAIGIQFVCGVFSFLLGHLCYITAFGIIAPFSPWSAVTFLFIAAAFVILFYKRLDKMGSAKVPLCVYVAVISAMLSIALLLPASLGIAGLLPASGAVLFVLSDALLARNLMIRSTRFSDTLSLVCYFAGQYLLALNAFLLIK